MQGFDSEIRTDEIFTPGGMSRRRRLMALMVTLMGLATFVTPLVQTDSEVLGRTRWSPLQVALAVHAGTLPGDHLLLQPEIAFRSIEALLGLGIVYCLLSLVVAAIGVFPSARFVGSASAIGVAVILGEWRFRYADLQDSIYGASSSFVSGHHVHAGILCLVLLGVQLLLGFIAATKQLD